MQSTESMRFFLKQLEDSGYPFQVYDHEDYPIVTVLYRKPAERSKPEDENPVTYEKCREFFKPMYATTLRSRLKEARFPEAFVDDVLKDAVLETEVITFCQGLLTGFPSSAILSGRTGAGKTFGCVWLAKQLFADRKILSAEFVRMGELNKQRHNSGGESRWDFNCDKDSDLLVLDDLGTESAVINIYSENQDKKGLAQELVDYRLSNKLPMLITTNLNTADLFDRYGERFVSRIQRWGTIGTFEKRADY